MNCCCLILNYNGYEETTKLFEVVSNYHFAHILIVDNCSTDDSYSNLIKRETDKVRVVKTERNGGYGSGNNYGMRYAFQSLGADCVLICNPDVVYEEALVYRLEQVFEQHSDVGVVSAVQYDRNEREISMSAWSIPQKWNYIFSVGAILKKWNRPFYYSIDYLHHGNTVEVDCVAGSLLMISRQAFEKTGGYDEDMFLYCEETTLGCKMKAAQFKTYICSDVKYVHMHGVSISKSIKSTVKQKRVMLNSHHLLLQKYLGANTFQLMIDSIIGRISLCEEAVKSMLNK